jgi:enterochelin esterase family protein
VEYQSASLSRRTQPPQLLFQGHHTLQGLDPLTGDVLWRFRHGGQGNAVSTSTHPVEIAKGRYFLKNHGDGGVLVRVGSDDGAWSAEEVWRTRHIRSTYIYAVAHAQRIYGYAGRILTAVDGATGERLWRSREPGDGLPAVIDSHLVIVTKDGSLSVAPAAADGYRESARLQLFDDIAWSPVSVADGRLYARSMSEIACVEVVPASVAAPSQVAPPLTLAAESLFGRFLTAVEVAADKAGVVDKFLDGQSSFPIVESDSLVHFVYRGAADEVSLTGDLVGWRYEQPLRRLEGTDLFYHTARVAADARTTYRFTVDLTRPEADPLNPRRLSSTFFGSASWFTMPSWTAPPHLQPLPGAEASRLDSLRLTGSDGGERLQVYLPAGYGEDRDRRYPVVYVHARGASSSWQLEGALDHLIGRRVQPLLVVFVPSLAGGEYEEYVGPLRETYLRRFVTEVVPRVDAEYRTVVDREGRANVGMMYGGAMAYYATLSHPEQFSRLAIQSLYWDATAQAAMGALLAPADRLPPLRIYLDWGRYDLRSPTEGLDIRRSTEDLARQLAQAGYAPAGGMASDGSGWESWRNRTDALFESLFPMQ